MDNKKIEVITVYNACNYGSFLQAYALQQVMSSAGYEVGFKRIDIDYDKVVGEGQFDEQYVRYEKEKYERLIDNQKLFHVWDESENNYKCSVIGSDTIWNLFDPTYEGIPYFVGKGLSSERVISYAASVGQQSLIKILLMKGYKLLPITKLDEISVRDDKTERLVKLFGKKPTRVLDPTFLYNFNISKPSTELPEHYILVYTYGFDEQMISKIREFSKKKNIPIVATGSLCEWADYNLAVDSFEWLWLVKNADYVLTNTFHGTVFSIKFNKQFVVLTKESDKVNSLLKEFSLSNRICKNSDFENILNQDIDYGIVQKFIKIRELQSKEFLLNGVKNGN